MGSKANAKPRAAITLSKREDLGVAQAKYRRISRCDRFLVEPCHGANLSLFSLEGESGDRATLAGISAAPEFAIKGRSRRCPLADQQLRHRLLPRSTSRLSHRRPAYWHHSFLFGIDFC